MRKLAIALALLAFCTTAHAALLDNPESFEKPYFPLPGDPFYPGWESGWGSCSGASGWMSGNDCGGAMIGSGGTDGSYCLTVFANASLYWGYNLAFNHGTPIVPGEIYEYFFDYMLGAGAGVFKLEFYDPNDVALDMVAWDPFEITTPGVWQHFSYTFRAPENAVSAGIVVGATGVGSIMQYDMIGLLPADCPYEIVGDEDGDCRVTLNDLALMLANWLVDCIDDPANPGCVTP